MEGTQIADLAAEEGIKGGDVEVGVAILVGEAEEIFGFVDGESSLFLHLASDALLKRLANVAESQLTYTIRWGFILTIVCSTISSQPFLGGSTTMTSACACVPGCSVPYLA